MTVPASNTRNTFKTTDPEQLLTHDAFVRGLARSLVRDEHGADDLVQDTWLVAIDKILRHLGLPTELPRVHPARASPQQEEFGFAE